MAKKFKHAHKLRHGESITSRNRRIIRNGWYWTKVLTYEIKFGDAWYPVQYYAWDKERQGFYS